VGSLNQPNNIFIDNNLNNFKIIYAAAGHPFVVFGITFKKLQIITKAKIYSIVD
jgi:prolyl-tRNA editing enzyme YbaK/EbsC (Cys-tRNA(Pro) deacylase)